MIYLYQYAEGGGGVETWERQPEESTQAFEAFTVYREERSITRVAQKLDKSRTVVGKWSSQWNWVDRCRDYDNSLQAVDFEEKRAAIHAMHQKHLQVGNALLAKAEKALTDLDLADCSPKVVLEALKLAMEIERKATYEELADSELRGEFDQNGYNPMLATPMLRMLADERKQDKLKGDEDKKIHVRIIDNVGGRNYDYSKLTPEEANTLRALSDKCMVYEDE